MRAVIWQHEENEGPGLLEKPLRDAGFTLVSRFRAPKHEDLEAELIVVMGGAMSVTSLDAHPFLRDEQAVLAERLALDKPVLGICLGAQLLASAAGATVTRGKNGFEVGIAPVRWTKQGLEDAATRGMPAKQTFAHWHEDTWSPVPGATLLASTDRYTQQGFKLGRSYGLQFHPELSAELFGGWLTAEAELLAADGKDVDELRASLPKLKSAEPQNIAFLEQLVRALRG
ncbi:MAG: type 1 glutamine amidotransferase [Archangium sp.]|nr:type 1 glutamine amidotransferase [Archangium sp.]